MTTIYSSIVIIVAHYNRNTTKQRMNIGLVVIFLVETSNFASSEMLK